MGIDNWQVKFHAEYIKKCVVLIEEHLFDSRICFTIIIYKSISHCCQYNYQ